MRENLVFYGIPETVATDGIQESCENLVKNVINNHMGINAENFIFDRVHRMGSDKARKPRAIVAKFHYFSERESLLGSNRTMRTLNGSYAKPTSVLVFSAHNSREMQGGQWLTSSKQRKKKGAKFDKTETNFT